MDFEIIDFHTHPFIKPENNFCMYKEKMDLNFKTTLEDIEDAKINMFCGSVICKGNTFENIKSCNREALKLRDIYGEKYVPGFHIHPNYVEESISELEFAHKNNVKIIGELVPYMNGWEDYSCDELTEILNTAEKYDMIVSVHTMNLEQMEKMVFRHKNIRFVFAHPGSKARVINHCEIMKKYDNVYLDLSGAEGISRYGIVRFLVDEAGADRIIFGTDYPIGNLKLCINAVLGEKLTSKEKELIFSGNAKRLLFNK